jgi:hypothetical protein
VLRIPVRAGSGYLAARRRSGASDRRGANFVTPEDLRDGPQHVFARVTANEAVAVHVRPRSSNLEDRRLGKKMSHGEPDGLLHSRFHSVRHQHDVETLSTAGLFYLFQTDGRADTVTSVFQPSQSGLSRGVTGHDQQECGCWDRVHSRGAFPEQSSPAYSKWLYIFRTQISSFCFQ